MPDFDMPFGGPFHILGAIVWTMVSFVGLVILVAVLVLLVRYLLVATTAHKLYIANNSPARTEEPAAPVVTKPVSKPRTPKAPPAV